MAKMICNRAKRLPGCEICPEAKPHVPGPTMLPEGMNIEKSFCFTGTALVEVRLIPAVDGKQGKLF